MSKKKSAAEEAAWTLDELRQEVDRLDDALQDLLIRRAEITRAIARVKQPSPAAGLAQAIRPAREAQILRRLIARHKGDLPRRVVVRIWREIIAASLQAQVKFQVHVYAGDSGAAFFDLAHAHFGSLTPVRGHSRVSVVVQECADEPNSVGVVPLPELEEQGTPWWAQLAPAGQPGPRIFAKLPFIVHPDENPPAAFAVGSVEQEASGDDTTLLRVESAAGFSRARLGGLLNGAGLEGTMIAAGQTGGQASSGTVLLAVKGYVSPADRRLAAFRESAGDSVLQADPVGGFANPIVLAPVASR